MYQAKILQSNQVVNGHSVHALAAKIPSPYYNSDYRQPSDSQIIKMAVQEGLIAPISGPEWFMALRYDAEWGQEVEDLRREKEAMMSFSLPDVSEQEDEIITRYATAWGMSPTQVKIALKIYNAGGDLPSFYSELEFRAMRREIDNLTPLQW